MNKKNTGIGITIVVLIILGILAYSLYLRDRNLTAFAEQVVSQSGGRWGRPDRVAELRRAIAAYERRIARHVESAARNADYWKLLGLRLQQRGLHGDALEAFERAIHYTPEDPTLHFHTGVSAAIAAKSFHLFPGRDNSDRVRHFALAEDAFLRAIDLDEGYLRPRYSLGVLYVFDLERPEEAIPHLQRVLEISRNDIETMFVLARAFYMVRNFQAALELFDRIIVLTGDEQRRLDAQNSRQRVLERMHG